jgi:site-specific recombinase XerD
MRGYPSTLIIYKSNASKYYWVRFYFNSKNKIKTTKCEHAKDAKKFAMQFYKDTLIDTSVNKKSSKKKAFNYLGNLFFQSTERNTNKGTYKSDVNRYKQHLVPFFKQQDIDTINNVQLNEFVEHLHKTGIKPATIKHHIIVLRKIMRFAIANDLMNNLPVFPRIAGKLKTSVKRDYFTTDEYDTLCKKAEELSNKKIKVRTHYLTIEMKYLIQFMVNSFIRPSDLRVLKHRHVKKMKDADSEWLTLTHPATKTNANEVQAMPATVGIYNKLLEYYKEEKVPHRPDDYVFMPYIKNRSTAMEVISRKFKTIVDATELEEKTEKIFTLYSLRHTAIMFRLIIGNVDTLVLSRNARTSQNMIDKFYAAHLTTDLVRKQLHNIPYTKSKPDNQKTAKTKKISSKIVRNQS